VQKYPLSAILITRNEAEILESCLKTLDFCSEIIVVDSLSTDDTVKIAQSYGAKVVPRAFNGFGEQKEFARQLANEPWVLSIDADEQIPEGLKAEIIKTIANPAFDAYQMPRLSSFLGRPFYHSGWWPDAPVRLFRKEAGRFNDKKVHEYVETTCALGTLTQVMTHASIRTIGQALDKSRRYSELGAQQLIARGKKVSILSGFTHGLAAFVRGYILQRGFLDGPEGLVSAFLAAQTAFWKYMLCWLQTRGKA
jgi:glycosyltransferase involved in cell wall biosynthesis